MLGHVLVDVLRLDLEEEAVCVGIEQITPVPVLGLHLVVVEVIHQMLKEVEDAHSHIYGMVEHQAALIHVDACQIIIEYVGTGEGWTGNEAAELIPLARSDQFDVDPIAEVLYHLPKDRIVHELVEVLLKVSGDLFSEICVHAYVGLHPGALVELESTVHLGQSHT